MKNLLGRVNVRTYVLSFTVLVLLSFIGFLWILSQDAERKYESLLSITIYDRNGVPLSIQENSKGHYVSAIDSIPHDFQNLLIKKEDKYFYTHLGIDFISTGRAILRHLQGRKSGGASTITQQLSKNLLGTELERNVLNKLYEGLYTLGIELFYSKEEILTMYANTVYLGNQVQGFGTASYAYFGKPFKETTHSEHIALLATLSHPNARNPWKDINRESAQALNERISPEQTFLPPRTTDTYSFQKDSFFELRTMGVTCTTSCRTTIDDSLTERVRDIVKRHIATGWDRGMRNAAVVIIDPQKSEIFALVGSKDPNNTGGGNQINMTKEPRPIGSTIKPLIYLKGFMDGLRPHSIVVDREYKYSMATGFPLYPKNYDGQYHGEVTLHEALSNSLNVPSVKVLEYIGLHNFYTFLSDTLKFKPIQNYDRYQYGIALGGLEMDLLTLTHYFTVFPRMGTLEPIRILHGNPEHFGLPPQSDISKKQIVSDKKYTQLIHAILSDRFSGVDQFGLKSNLNIQSDDYGVKTGTSRDFHDSWIVGYTGDFVVGVWVGNTENEPMTNITGQSGAGAIWHDTMNILLTSPYNKKTSLLRDSLAQFPIEHSQEWGLLGDIPEEHRTLLLEDTLIISPYHSDSFEFFENVTIPLKATKDVLWSANGNALGAGKEISFTPPSPGGFEIMAIEQDSSRREIIHIDVATPQ